MEKVYCRDCKWNCLSDSTSCWPRNKLSKFIDSETISNKKDLNLNGDCQYYVIEYPIMNFIINFILKFFGGK